jgi:hypothetical protein
MKISSNIEQYFDDEGRPLVNGRVSFYKHDSDILADIFYLESDDYVHADNPVTTSDDGRVPTIWFEAAVVDVKVEKCLPDGSYEQIDTFQIGFDYPKAANSTLAYGIEELKNTDPAVGVVQVIGYHNDNDAPARFYIWDANCTTAADGGVIIESDVGEEGRWVLIWDDEKLPSSVYGIVPGSNEANIAAFIGYPDVVGSYNIKMPPIPRFMAGTYTSNTTFSTTKPLYFDKGAKFPSADFVCTRAIIPENSDYVADFSFTGENVEAHSSWFRTVQEWWHCGAHTMVFDETNHFANFALTISADLLGKVLVGNTRVTTTYSNGSYLQIRNCSILGRKLFSPSQDRLYFTQMDFTTDWFTSTNAVQYDFGLLTGGHRLDVRTSNSNTLDFANFASPNVYYKARLANGDTVFDGHGATYSSFTVNDQFTSISNCRVPSMIDRKCQTWKNVFIEGGLTFDAGGASTVTMEGCSFYLGSDLPAHIQAIQIDNCDVRTGSKWRTSVSRISVTNSNWSATCELGDAFKPLYSLAQPLSFDHCVLSMGGNAIWTNNLTMTHCTSNAHVYLVPYLDGDTYRMAGTFVDNLFVQGALIECNVKNMSEEYAIRDVHAALTFKDNRFNQDDPRGIVIPWLTQELDFLKPFLAAGSTAASLYKNNTGKCPAEQPTKLFLASAMVSSSIAAGGLWYLPPATYKQRYWDLSPQTYWYPGLMGVQFEPSSDSWNRFNGRDARIHYGALMHVARQIPTDAENDQFGVVHAWEDNDGFNSDLEVFYF